MKQSKFLISFAILLTFSHESVAKSYKNHKVVSMKITDEVQLNEMQKLENQPGFTFWDSPEYVNTKLELVMSPEQFPVFEEIASINNITFRIATNDMQTWLDMEKPLKQRKEGFGFDKYNLLDDIYQFLDDMQAAYPEKVTVHEAGKTYEDRLIKAIKISTSENNPAIFIEANIHAREWISSATSLWIINEILTTNDPEIRQLVDSVTWFFVPIANPDGYHFTHVEDRLWRKTRSIHNILCRGVDPNRNFGYNWRQGGSSNVACTTTYAGPSAFSEIETRSLMEFYETVVDKVDTYICFHSAAQMLMYPLGNTLSTELVPNVEDLHDIATTAGDALEKRHGTKYAVGNAMKTLYVTSGSSRDHAYGHFKTPLVFTYEMREGKGESIFILPVEEIKPNSEEIFDSLIAMIVRAKELGYYQQKN